MENLQLEQNTRLCLVPLLDIYQYKTTSLPMLVVALSWEVDWAVLGAGDSWGLRTDSCFRWRRGERVGARGEGGGGKEQEEEEKLERRSKIWRRRKSEFRGRSRRIPPPHRSNKYFSAATSLASHREFRRHYGDFPRSENNLNNITKKLKRWYICDPKLG